jgi:23S rRNA (adenine2503-C2)-methyltransferase
MKVVASSGREDIAVVYVAELEAGKYIEFVEAIQPPMPRNEKWVLMVSTLYGCPVGCSMCDAGGYYHGKVSKDDLFAQIDYMVDQRYPDWKISSDQFKIQFARMGDPAFNMAVLDVIEELPKRYQAPNFMPSVSTIAPHGVDDFFERLLQIKNAQYRNGHFQFQFSVHTTDEAQRDEMIPVKKWNFSQMAEFGERFYQEGDRKITLNFALAEGMAVDPQALLQYFSPEKFLIKITPLNPTYRAAEHGLSSYIDPYSEDDDYAIIQSLRHAGYRVIMSIGEIEENYIGSNCGQYVRRHLEAIDQSVDGYTYRVQEFS